MEDTGRALRVLALVEAERRRISVRLHDDPVQVLSALTMRLQLLAQAPGDDPELLEAAGRGAQSALASLRALMAELGPGGLDRVPLAEAVAFWARHRLGDRAEVECDAVLASEPPEPQRALLFRIAQTALAELPAAVAQARITLRDGDGGVRLTVDLEAGEGDVAARAHFVVGPALDEVVTLAELAGGTGHHRAGEAGAAHLEVWLPT